jgi:hypothetical protein
MAGDCGGASAASEARLLAALAGFPNEVRIFEPVAACIEANTFGRSAATLQGRIIPSLAVVPRHAALRQGEARLMLETQLVRARKRIADVLEDCQRDVAATFVG